MGKHKKKTKSKYQQTIDHKKPKTNFRNNKKKRIQNVARSLNKTILPMSSSSATAYG
jgi:hypothetical protein